MAFRGEFTAASLKRIENAGLLRSIAAFRGEFTAASLKRDDVTEVLRAIFLSAVNSPRPH